MHQPTDLAFVTFASAAHASELLFVGKQALQSVSNLRPIGAEEIANAYHDAFAGAPASRPLTNASPHLIKRAEVHSAPPPSEVIWDNTTLTAAERRVKRYTSACLLVAVCVLGAFPSLLASFLTNFAPVASLISAFSFIFSWSSAVQGLVQNLLPSLIVFVFLFFLRTMVIAIGKRSGKLSYGQLQLYVTRAFWWVNYFSVFITISVAGSAIAAAGRAIGGNLSGSSAVLFELTNSIAGQSGFFIAFVIIASLQGMGVSISQVINVMPWWWTQRNLYTQREFDDALIDPLMDWDDYVPSANLMLGVGFLYAFLNPVSI